MHLPLFYVIVANLVTFIPNLQAVDDDFFLTSQCRELMQQRRERIEMLKKAQILAQKNHDLLETVPRTKRQMRLRLERLSLKIEREFAENAQSLQKQDENLIKMGCPPFEKQFFTLSLKPSVRPEPESLPEDRHPPTPLVEEVSLPLPATEGPPPEMPLDAPGTQDK
jgi:hypothetical protein